jgi:4-aminobutyrate aminotransferase-like enzyme
MEKVIPRVTASPPLIEFTEKLLGWMPGNLKNGRVNYAASGTEAVELAVSFARANTKRPIIISYHDSHHGYIGTPYQLSGDPRIKQAWPPKISDIIHIPYPKCYRCPFKASYPSCDILCLHYLENVIETAALPGQIAALIIEPVLVNGGLYVPPKDYVKGLADICDTNGILLIVDEVYTGVAKSGRFLVIDHWDLKPDILCLGKALGGGFPLATVVTRRDITDHTLGSVRFTGTFTGNPVACSAGIATLEYVEKNNLMNHVTKVGGYLIEALKNLSERKIQIGEVRGCGLLLGVDLVEDKDTKKPAGDYASYIVAKALEKGLIIRRVGRYRNILALTPPLTLKLEEAEKAVKIFEEIL